VKLTTSAVIPAPRDRVFAALIDPDVLHRCIPGCESIAATGAEMYEAVLKVGVAGLKGRYAGKAAIRDKVPPGSLTLSFEGKGGPGFVRGSAAIVLTDEGGATRIACETDVQVGGLIAAVGSRLVEAASRKLADDFFKQLSMALSDAS
jgi:carbon monoxide dehydrogenase subunit G